MENNNINKIIDSKYNTAVVVGAGFGDEGKGKITDWISSQWADVVVRGNGGPNAGHTVNVDGTKISLRALPSGVLSDNIENVIGNGCVINLEELVDEIQKVEKAANKEIKLKISDRAHIITDYDIIIDKQINSNIKTTGNGIGPCYSDKSARTGLRICDILTSEEHITEKLKNSYGQNYLSYRNYALGLSYDSSPFPSEVAKKLYEYGKIIKKYVCDTSVYLNKEIQYGRNALFEGAQAAMLDIDYGSYPYVTSSNTSSAGLAVGTGVAPKYFNNVIGVIKAYTTRVGAGPFVTEIQDGKLANYIRETGHEYGTVTGRARRIGWFDCNIVKQANRINGFSGLAIMLLDVLTGIDEIKICVDYASDNGKLLKGIPAEISELETTEPVYITMPCWKEDISSCKSFDELPPEAINYIDEIEKQTGIPVKIISVGPDRNQTIVK